MTDWSLSAPTLMVFIRALIHFDDNFSLNELISSPSSCWFVDVLLVVGSNVVYDEMMNLRNILWLAPLPSNSSKAWVAPGIFHFTSSFIYGDDFTLRSPLIWLIFIKIYVNPESDCYII